MGGGNGELDGELGIGEDYNTLMNITVVKCGFSIWKKTVISGSAELSLTK